MIRWVLYLVVVAALVAGAVWLADNPGSVTIEWQGYRVDTSFGILAAAILAIAAAAAALYRFWRGLRSAPARIGRSWRGRKRRRGYQALTQGMVAVAAGDAEEALRQARRADVLLNEPPLTMLLSAQAAQLNGDDAAARRYFTAMLDHRETEFLGLRGLIVQAQKENRPEEALAYAERARRLRPKTGWVLTTLYDLQARAGRWQDAEATAQAAVRARAMTAEEGRRKRAIALYARAAALVDGEAAETGGKDEALDLARRAAELAPDFVPAIVLAARLLKAAGRDRRAARLLESAWARAPHPDLVAAHLDVAPAASDIERVRQVQKLVAPTPDHAEAHLAIARAALDALLWGEARRHLSALGEEPPARACRLWAELEEAEHGDLGKAREWLARAAAATPDPAWVCADCGAVAAAWQPHCPRCGAFDRFRWRSPERIVRPALSTESAGEETAGEPALAEAERPLLAGSGGAAGEADGAAAGEADGGPGEGAAGAETDEAPPRLPGDARPS